MIRKNYFKLYGKRICVIALFYLINFELWELIAPIISGEWASFIVYVLLFVIVLLIFRKELKEKLLEFVNTKLKDRRFYLRWLIVLVIDLALTMFVLWLANTYCNAILPANNENVKNQLHAVPLVFGVMQGCVFAPVIEEMVFRYSVIGRPERKSMWFVLTMASIVLFDCIHIVAPLEFFYYLAPAVILTLFYGWNKNIFASILLHSSINVVGYLALLVGAL
ncbi:CPBP family intramembrane glutamic endopeptidase [Butyrivibrio sp. AC2005]|uniref:CPBP family intramembrane glutamic endopeptidase n=1 Tax=Butyrivibrio sp. AC2005 TaxID=1280672 RepID=UPI00041C4DAA|nr:type II CAAX endopeptidase family protein [Butyrivibrio sp. AC2005]